MEPQLFHVIGSDLPIPKGYRLATIQDVADNKYSLMRAVPSNETANLADGSVEGGPGGGNVRNDIRKDVNQKLIIRDSSQLPPTTFKLFDIDEDLPQGYRLATVQDVEKNQQALREAMPGQEIANLADGSVDGVSYGCKIRKETRNDVSQKLAVPGNEPSRSLKFKLFDGADGSLPRPYRLATRFEVETNKEALFEAMPKVEIANLVDGSVEGAFYGGRTSAAQPKYVTQRLAVEVVAAS